MTLDEMKVKAGDVPVPRVTDTQLALIKATIAKDATDAELQLFFFDCQRHGVHPLDKLIHFTKRGGKYTPIASIDFMRQRAAQTHEYAGSDDAVFAGQVKSPAFTATVTVYRLVQHHRCAFTASARWTEYKPEANDFMWQKMPHTMLGKCAEALALRKGFPQQLAGLYVNNKASARRRRF
jgi:phage recombination protein Bet